MKSGWLVGLERGLVCAVLLFFAFPFFVSLPFNIPGLQGLTPHKLLLPFLIPLALIRWLRGAYPNIWWGGTTCLFGALVLWAGATGLAGPRQYWPHNARHLAWLVLAFVFFLEVAALLATRKGRVILAYAITITGTLLCLFGYLEMWSGDRLDWFFRVFRPTDVAPDVLRTVAPPPLPLHMSVNGQRSLSSTYSSPFAFALFGIWVFERLARRGAADRGLRWRHLMYIAAAIGAAGIVPLSASRGALVQLLIGILIAVVLLSLECPARRRWYVVMALLVTCGVGLIAAVGSPLLQAKLKNLSAVSGVLGGGEGKTSLPSGSAMPQAPGPAAQPGEEKPGVFSALQRVTMARVAFAMAASNPIFGVGFANYRPLLYDDPRFSPMFAFALSSALDVYDAHSFPLTALATTGAVGLGLLLSLAWVVIRGLVGAWRQPATRGAATAGLALAAAAATGMAMSFSLVDPMSCILFALLIGASQATRGEAARQWCQPSP